MLISFFFPVVTGQSKPTDAEFNALAQVLGITNVSAVEQNSLDIYAVHPLGTPHWSPHHCLMS